MKNLLKYIPRPFIQLLVSFLLATVFLSLTRVVFFVFNASAFSSVSFLDFIAGTWVDAMALGLWLIPFYFLALLPFHFTSNFKYQKFIRVLFYLIFIFLMALNLMDVEYFKYTSKRSTADLFTVLGAGNDFSQLFTTFVADFWWLILIWLILMISFIWLDIMFLKLSQSLKIYKQSYFFKTIWFVFGFAFFFIIGRGGFGYRPADMLTVAQYTSIENTPLVLNTPLSIIKTLGKASLEEKEYFQDQDDLLNPVQKPNKITGDLGEKNVMVIVLESFGDEWLGKKNGLPFTPFLDSLIDESLYFTNAFANGKKSIEAVPAIFASIPTLMETPYISSHYGTNKIMGLPELLKTKGYESAFFHGATNGSMKFDEFANLVGFDHYFGRTEYNNEDHCDDTWGVLDEYFNPWTAKMMTEKLSEPFFSALFTLSSHHPYFVPEEHAKTLPKGNHPIAQSIAYGDYSLKLFFEEAKKQAWYDNTIFILVADHTPASEKKYFSNRVGMFKIPIVIFDPSQEIKPDINNEIFSQIDIFPTVLDLIGFDQMFYAFGKSFFDNEERMVLNYLGGTYHLFINDYLVNFREDAVQEVFNYKQDSLLKSNLIDDMSNEWLSETENHIKGYIQRYNQDLIGNKMVINGD